MAMSNKEIGRWAFVIGIVIAIIAGIVDVPGNIWILTILGLIVGFLNITAKETNEFLIAAITLVVLSSITIVQGNEPGTAAIAKILKNIIDFIGPAALIVALKAIYVLGEE